MEKEEHTLVGFIPAAAFSNRIKELTKDKPKSFLKIKGKKVIEYILDNLAQAGIKDTYIVVGFLKGMFKETIGNEHKGMKIHYIDNDEYKTTQQSHTVYLGKELFKKHPILLIHSDIFCYPSLIRDVIDSDFDNVSIVDETSDFLKGHEYVAEGENDVINQIGPNLAGNVHGEFLGLSKLSSKFMMEFCDYMENRFKTGGEEIRYETLMSDFLKATSLVLNYQKIGDKRGININYEEDYHKAKNIADEI